MKDELFKKDSKKQFEFDESVVAVFVDLIHQVAFDRRLDMLNEILVCSIKRFHGFSLKQGAKIIKPDYFGKPTLQFIVRLWSLHPILTFFQLSLFSRFSSPSPTRRGFARHSIQPGEPLSRRNKKRERLPFSNLSPYCVLFSCAVITQPAK